MSSRDLHDGATARALAERIGTIERLKLLTMLTYADISAVNPQAMTPWRLEQLWRVYLLAHEELTKELETERIHSPAGVAPERAHFLEGLPMRYLRTHTAAEIDAHYTLARQLESRAVAIEIHHERGIYRLTLLTKDRPGAVRLGGGRDRQLRAEHSEGGGVHQRAGRRGGYVHVLRSAPHAGSESDRSRPACGAWCAEVLEGKHEAEKLLRGRPKPLLPVKARLKPRVAVKNDVSEAATLVEIVAEDRPGLLYDLARVIADVGLQYRGGADRHRGAQGSGRVLSDAPGPQAGASGGGAVEGGTAGGVSGAALTAFPRAKIYFRLSS